MGRHVRFLYGNDRSTARPNSMNIERERPEFHAQRLFTVGEVNNLQRQAVDLDDDVLMRLYSIHESGSILDDDGFVCPATGNECVRCACCFRAFSHAWI